ncbi:MAG: polymerase, sigma-24 subunit, subfamily, partial [Solirubrobacterales bacterium]|nr:polymerase, sigma-24 subunit, subfamily [Solirubrobacterales bacterium]
GLIHDRAAEGLASALAAALEDLPATDRDALLLVAWGELSYDEAARATGVPIGTLRSRIHRARRRLRAALRETPDDGGTS